MPMVRCGKLQCESNHGGVCDQSYIYLEPIPGAGKVWCMAYKKDKEYDEALTKLAANPKLKRDKEEMR